MFKQQQRNSFYLGELSYSPIIGETQIANVNFKLISHILSVLDETDLNSSSQLIIGGDFNVHLDAEMDNEGGRVEKKDSMKNISDMKLAYDLVDIWRIRNPEKR